MKHVLPLLLLLAACTPSEEGITIQIESEACDEDCVLATIQTLSDVLFVNGHPPYATCVDGLTVNILEPGSLGDEGPGLYHNPEHDDPELQRTVLVEVGDGIQSDVLPHELFHDYEAACLETAPWTRTYARMFGGHFVMSVQGFELVAETDLSLTDAAP